MDRRIRALALLLAACFVLLFLQLNNLQVRLSPSLKNLSATHYDATTTDPFTQPRGDIVAANGAVLATSTPTSDGYGEQRHYPLGPLFADVTGYYDTVQSAAPYGIEAEYNDDLSYHQANQGGLKGVLTDQSGTDTVVLTVSEALQKVAQQAFAASCPGQPGGCQLGAVVAIDVQNGDVLAMYGLPTYDPNLLSSHDAAAVSKAYNELANPPGGASKSPLINFATGQLTAPGSTMKVITTAAVFDHDPALETMVFPYVTQLKLPDTTSLLHNFGGESCGGTLAQALAKSCDTAYAELGLDLTPQDLVDEAESFGFNSKPPIDLPDSEVAAATIPSAIALSGTNAPFRAYSAIGQYNVGQSALTDALVAAAIGDGGKIMAPHLLAHVVSQSGTLVDAYQPHVWKTATSPATATAVRKLMRDVANSGTAAGVFPSSEHVAAKTGTAETQNGCSANWMIATAPADPTDTPTIAVAAVVPYQQGLTCGDQGATVAGPIVDKVLSAGLALQANAKGTS